MTPRDGMLVLEVADDGPGFDEAVMDDAGTSLYRLRAKARELGGDLRKFTRFAARDTADPDRADARRPLT